MSVCYDCQRSSSGSCWRHPNAITPGYRREPPELPGTTWIRIAQPPLLPDEEVRSRTMAAWERKYRDKRGFFREMRRARWRMRLLHPVRSARSAIRLRRFLREHPEAKSS